MSVDVRAGSGARSSFVNTVISRPSPGSKYRWLSAALSRLGCSNTNGIPSTPSQKSIEVCRSAPTRVMWCTPWLCSFRIGPLELVVVDELRLVLAPLEAAPRDELDPRLHDEHVADSLTDGVGQAGVVRHVAGELDRD